MAAEKLAPPIIALIEMMLMRLWICDWDAAIEIMHKFKWMVVAS